MDEIFLEVGYPISLRTDGAKNFQGGFGKYLTDHGVEHKISSAYFPEGNGMAERHVFKVKSAMKRAISAKQDVELTLAAMRNTNLQSINNSPSNLFYKRQIRCHLPQLKRKIDISMSMEKKESMRQEQLKNPRRRKKRSKEFEIGDRVLVQCEKTKKWIFKGTVVEKVTEDSYNIKFKKPNETNEKIYLRNRSMMKDPNEEKEQGEDEKISEGKSIRESTFDRQRKTSSGGNAQGKIDHPMRLRSQVRFSTHSNSRERSSARHRQRHSQPSRSHSRPRHTTHGSVKGKSTNYEY